MNAITVCDAESVRQVWAGQAGSFEALVEKYYRLIYAIGMSRLRKVEAAEDLAQEVFLRVFLGLKHLAKPEQFGPWVCQIARNLALDWLRHGQTRSRLLGVIPSEYLAEVADPHMDARDQMAASEEQDAVRGAIGRLPEEQRELVLLHYMEDLTHREIAERTGMHHTTVSRKLAQALRTMRGALEPTVRESLAGYRSRGSARARACQTAPLAAALPASIKNLLVIQASETLDLAAIAQALPAPPGLVQNAAQSISNYFTSGGKLMIATKSVSALLFAGLVVGGVMLAFNDNGHSKTGTAAPGNVELQARISQSQTERTVSSPPVQQATSVTRELADGAERTQEKTVEGRQLAQAAEPAAATAADETPDLSEQTFQIKLPVGRSYTLKIKMDMVQDIKFEDLPTSLPEPMKKQFTTMKQIITMGQDIGFSVMQQRPDGGHAVDMKFLAMALDMNMNNGMMRMSFDSTKPESEVTTATTPDGIPKEALPRRPGILSLKGMIGQSMMGHLNAKGEVERVEGAENLILALTKEAPPEEQQMMKMVFQNVFTKQTYKQMFANGNGLDWVPDHKVKVGDKWTKTDQIDIPMLGSMTQVADYHFKGWDRLDGRKVAVIECVATQGEIDDTSQTSPLLKGMKMKIEGGTATGEILFDPELGLAPKMTMDQNTKFTMTIPIPQRGQQPSAPAPKPIKMRTDLNQKATFTTVDLKGPKF